MTKKHNLLADEEICFICLGIEDHDESMGV